MKKIALAILLVFSCLCVVRAQQRCFQPLANPNSHNSADWKDFIDFTPTETPEGVKHLHRLADGVGDRINLDFYSFTFRKPADSSKTIESVFKDIRLNLRRFVVGKGESSRKNFGPYRSSTSPDDPLLKRNEKLWGSDNPKGALMSFGFEGVALGSSGGRGYFVGESGDVVVECASKTDFIFMTAYTVENKEHPVSGNRGFGIMDKGDGIWTIYAKASDRESREDDHVGKPYYGNTFLKFFLGEDVVFQKGHEFWLTFFPNLFDYLEEQGMKVNRKPFVTNSCRYSYSPSSGPSQSPLFCVEPPSPSPLVVPSQAPSISPSQAPLLSPSPGPSASPSPGPSASPSVSPSPTPTS